MANNVGVTLAFCVNICSQFDRTESFRCINRLRCRSECLIKCRNYCLGGRDHLLRLSSFSKKLIYSTLISDGIVGVAGTLGVIGSMVGEFAPGSTARVGITISAPLLLEQAPTITIPIKPTTKMTRIDVPSLRLCILNILDKCLVYGVSFGNFFSPL